MSVPPATQKPCTLQSTGFSEWKRLMKPRTLRDIIWKSVTGSQFDSGAWLAAITAGSSGEPGGPPAPIPSSIAPSAEATRS